MTSSPSPPRDHATEYYFFVVAVAFIALLLLASNMIVVGCLSSRCSFCRAVKRLLRSCGLLPRGGGLHRNHEQQISRLIPASKLKREQVADAAECSVCLQSFEEGEEVRQLPGCGHLFHAPCIDMWLYSHTSCPLCRASVLPKAQRCPPAAPREEGGGRSLRGTAQADAMSGLVIAML